MSILKIVSLCQPVKVVMWSFGNIWFALSVHLSTCDNFSLSKLLLHHALYRWLALITWLVILRACVVWFFGDIFNICSALSVRLSTHDNSSLVELTIIKAGIPRHLTVTQLRFDFGTTSRPALGPVGTGGLSPGVSPPESESDYSPPTTAELRTRGASPSLPHAS